MQGSLSTSYDLSILSPAIALKDGLQKLKLDDVEPAGVHFEQKRSDSSWPHFVLVANSELRDNILRQFTFV